MNSRAQAGGICLAVIVLAVFAVFRSVPRWEFVLWDDDNTIYDNFHLRPLTAENVKWMFTDVSYQPRYQPLAWLGWAVQGRVFGLTARACHAGNVLFHAVNALLVFRLVQKLLRLKGAAGGGGWPDLAAATAATLIWALHPFRVEAVAWATGRRYLQVAFFILLSTLAYLESLTAPAGRKRRVWLGASTAALVLALLTYPAAAAYVGVFCVIDLYFRRRIYWREKIPFAAATGLVMAVTLWARFKHPGGWPAPTLREFGMMARIAQAFYVWAYYVWRPFWPTHLSLIYPTLFSFRPGEFKFLASGAAVVLATGVLVWNRRRWPGLCALWLCHLIVLIPLLGLTEHPNFLSDHYNYVEAIVWTVGLAAALLGLARRPRWLAAAVTASLLAAAGLADLSAAQTRVWRNSESVFRWVLSEPMNTGMRATALARLAEVLRGQGRLPEAAALLRESQGIEPSALAELSLAKMAETRGDGREAMLHYREAIRLEPASARVHFYAGLGLAKDRRTEAEAIAQYQQAVRLDPTLGEARNNLAVAYVREGRIGEAIEQLQTALRIDPHFEAARENLEKINASRP